MKKNLLITFSTLFVLFIYSLNGCVKIYPEPPSTVYGKPPIIRNSFTEEFDSFYLLQNKGWNFLDKSAYADARTSRINWTSGQVENSKWPGPTMPAYSYKVHNAEYAFAGFYAGMYPPPNVISAWMLTAPIEMKNGDMISFYTRCDTVAGSINRLQVWLNPSDTTSNVGSSATSTGKFTVLLKDINPNNTPTDYPRNWTRVDITVTGLASKITSRLAFRYFVPLKDTSLAIGVDQLKFQKQ